MINRINATDHSFNQNVVDRIPLMNQINLVKKLCVLLSKILFVYFNSKS